MSQRNNFRIDPGVVELADEAIRRVETRNQNAIVVPRAGRSGVSIGKRQMDLGQNRDFREALISHGIAHGVIRTDEDESRARALFSERYGRRINPRDEKYDPAADQRSQDALRLARDIMGKPGADGILRQAEIKHLRDNVAGVERICRNAPERARDFCNSRQGQVEMLVFRHQSGEQADEAIRKLFTGERVTVNINRRESTIQLEGNMDVEQFRRKIWDNTPYGADPRNRKNIDTRRQGLDELYREKGIDDGSRARINPGKRSEAETADPAATPEPTDAPAAAEPTQALAPRAPEAGLEQSANIQSVTQDQARGIDINPLARRTKWTPDPAKIEGAIAGLGVEDLPAWAKNLLGRDAMANGADAAVKGFQRAINAATKPPTFDYHWGLGGRTGRVDVDGDLGPQTRAGFGRALEKQGPDGFAKLYALDQFGRYVKDVDRGRASPDGFEDVVAGTLGQAKPDAAERAQETLNFARHDRGDPFEPLKIDGWIGPKSTGAFAETLGQFGPARLTERFAGKDFWDDENLD